MSSRSSRSPKTPLPHFGGGGPAVFPLNDSCGKDARREREKMKKTKQSEVYVFDTSALLTLWNNEEGADEVEGLLRSNALGELHGGERLEKREEWPAKQARLLSRDNRD